MINLSFRLFILTLVFAPLAFGSVEHWSLMTVELLASLSLCLVMLGLVYRKDPVYRVPGILPLFLLLLYILLQLLPIPVELLKIISPMSWEAYKPIYEQMMDKAWLPISINQKVTLQEFLRLGGYVLFYIATIQLLRSADRIKFTLTFVLILAGIIAFLATLQLFSANGHIYWFREAPGGRPGGPWVNINQYSGYIEMLCPLALGLFLYHKPRVPSDASLRERFISFFTSPSSNLNLLFGGIFFILCSSVLIALCRGGIVTILLSTLFFIAMVSYRLRKYGRASVWAAICFVLVFISWLGWEPIIAEFGSSFDTSGVIQDARFTVWSDTVAIIKDYPLFGSGFGTYLDVYPAYKTFQSHLVFDHAHNDYLELLVDGGVVAFFLVVWFVSAVIVHAIKKLKVRRDRFAILVGIGILSGMVAVLLHASVDFNLHNGAVGLYFFFICGSLIAVVNSRYNFQQTESYLQPSSRRSRQFFIVFSSALFVSTAAIQFSILMASANYSKIKSYYITRHLDDSLYTEIANSLEASAQYDPFEGRYHFYRGDLAVVKEGREQAFDHYLEAARRQPMQGVYLQRLGMMMPVEMQDKASEIMAEGYHRALDKEQLLLSWAEWLLVTKQRDHAKELMTDYLASYPAESIELLPILQLHEFSRQEMLDLLPEHIDTWIRLGTVLENMGEIEESEFFRSHALELYAVEEEINPNWFTQLITFYRRHGRDDEALEIIRIAVEAVPAYARFHYWLGEHYQGQGILYRAEEEYQQAVILDPKNDVYRRKLNRVQLDMEFGVSQ